MNVSRVAGDTAIDDVDDGMLNTVEDGKLNELNELKELNGDRLLVADYGVGLTTSGFITNTVCYVSYYSG